MSRVLLFLSLLSLGCVAIAQDTASVSSVDKARYVVSQLRVKRYKITPYENFFYLHWRANGTELFGGFVVEKHIIRLDENRFIGSFGLSASVQDSTANLLSFLVKYDTPYGYHHLEYGLGLSARTGIDKGFWPNGYLGYKFHNPTKRVAFTFGLGIHPVKDNALIWTQIGIGYAFNVFKARDHVPWK